MSVRIELKREVQELIDAARALTRQEESGGSPVHVDACVEKLIGKARAFVHREDFLDEEDLAGDDSDCHPLEDDE